MSLELEVVDDAEAAARRGAEAIERAAAAGPSFSIALSGGRTPWRMLDLLDPVALAGPGAAIFQVDERIAPGGDPARNLTELREHLPPPALERLRPMPVDEGLIRDGDGAMAPVDQATSTALDPLEAATARYAAELPPALDLVHLGLGPDGHTASLVPGDPVLEVDDRPVAVTDGEYQGHRRMTLTYPGLARARRLLWLVTGEEKRDALSRLLAADPSIPAGRVQPRDGIVIADRAAAPR